MLSVNQHWDKLKACAVGRSYPPELYDFIENPKVRNMMEKIAIETEEDYQKIIAKLEEFDVKVVRNDLDLNEDGSIKTDENNIRCPPPMCPRDTTMMVGDTFYMPKSGKFDWKTELINNGIDEDDIPNTWKEVRSNSKLYEKCSTILRQQTQSIKMTYSPLCDQIGSTFRTIEEYVKSQGNNIVYGTGQNSAMCARVGKDLYFGLLYAHDDHRIDVYRRVKKLFPDYRCHVNDGTVGHADANFCPVVPGLIVSLSGYQVYSKTFPGWEVVELPGQSWGKVDDHMKWKDRTGGRWWVEGQSFDNDLVDYIETWLYHWVNYVEETVFDVNMLVIDKHNVICNNYNEKVFKKFEEYGITPHVINFRHRYFWDGGIHCITSDLDRDGERIDYFPERGENVIS